MPQLKTFFRKLKFVYVFEQLQAEAVAILPQAHPELVIWQLLTAL